MLLRKTEKVLKNPNFQVLERVREVEEPFYYEEIPHRKGNSIKLQTIKKFYPVDKPIPKRQIPVYREMTFDEIFRNALKMSEIYVIELEFKI